MTELIGNNIRGDRLAETVSELSYTGNYDREIVNR